MVRFCTSTVYSNQSPPNDQHTHRQKLGMILIFSCIFVWVYVCVCVSLAQAKPLNRSSWKFAHILTPRLGRNRFLGFSIIFQGYQILCSKKRLFLLFFNISLDINELELWFWCLYIGGNSARYWPPFSLFLYFSRSLYLLKIITDWDWQNWFIIFGAFVKRSPKKSILPNKCGSFMRVTFK